MKNLFLNIAGMLLLGVGISACTSEDFSGGDPNSIPKINEADYTVSVDQETNVVTFTYNKPGEYPVWTIHSTPEVTSTVNGFQKKFIFKGTYSYTLKVGNRNGVSDGETSGTFTIDNTRYDFSKTIAALTGDGTKEWRIYSATAGHLACGPEGTEGTEWYSAKAQEKADQGIYDDRITFSNTNDYTYSAGNDGLTFCNVNVTNLGVTGAGADYSTAVTGQFGAQTAAKYQLGYDDDKQQETITLPGKTLFPYMGNNVQMEKAYTLRILKITDKYMDLVLDLPGIAWQMKFINGEDPAVSDEFDPNNVNWTTADNALNLAKSINSIGEMTYKWFDGDNWHSVPNPTLAYADGVYTLTTNAQTTLRWQGQCAIENTHLALEAGKAYDFSITIEASEAFDNGAIKVCDAGDDPTLIFKENVSLSRGKNVLRFAKLYPKANGADGAIANGKLVLDLGGCPAGLTLKVSNIIVQEHNPIQ